MNTLRVLTKPSDDGNFIVYWTNSTECMRGAVQVFVPEDKEDRAIVAELTALQHLLEVEEAIGNNICGNQHTKLVVSMGAIRKLSRKDSAKQVLAEYALFLTTRFKDSPLKVEKDEGWIDFAASPSIQISAASPIEESIHINSIGSVMLTSHVVERYAERAGIQSMGEAWRKLCKVACEEKVVEIEKNNPRTRMKYALKGKEEGRYYLHPTKLLMMVVANDKKGRPSLVTAYPVPA